MRHVLVDVTAAGVHGSDSTKQCSCVSGAEFGGEYEAR